MTKVECNALCYVNGKGCFISSDGRYPHYFAQDGSAKKQSTKSYFNYKKPDKDGSAKTK